MKLEKQTVKKSTVIAISIVAGLVITGLILLLSFSKPDSPRKVSEDSGAESAGEFIVSSDAVAGENNSEIKKQLTPQEVAGYYVDESDGWYYKLEMGNADGFDGVFSAGFDSAHSSAEQNPQNHITMNGTWKLENGEIKLFSEGIYRSSMWACDGYIVDSLNYFVGKIDFEENKFQTILASKAGESGDTQIFNFYNDGKMIMEIIRNDGTMDSAADSGAQSDLLPSYQMIAGTYEKKENKVIITLGDSAQEFYIVNDGLAKWIYVKK